MAVYPQSWRIDVGLGGSYRDIVTNEEFVPMVLDLSGLSGDRAKDISGRGNHGTYIGTGWTFGVPLGVPEGMVGPTFNGNVYINVPTDDIQLTGVWNLSLAGNRIGIAFPIKTTHNTATARCIIGKQETNSTGNGWHVALVSGGIRFYLKVAGVEIINITRGSIADGNLHLVYCLYRPDANEVKIFIDGVQSGATATGTTEAAATTADLRVGMFTNGVAGDGSGFIGTLGMTMISREGNTDLATSLQPTMSWTDVSADVRGQFPIEARQGIQGGGPLDHIARPGTLTFAMNNSARNSGSLVGYYSPGHANCRSGFQVGAPVRWSVTYGGVPYRLFYGYIKTVAPVPGVYGPRYSMVTCSDWIDVASRVPMSAVAAQLDIASDDVLRRVLDQTDGRVPPAFDISDGASVFPFALDLADGDQESVLSEIARTVGSERGYFYQRGDTVNDAVVVFESRSDRQLHFDLDATFTNSMHGLEVSDGLNRIVNIARVVVTPRRKDAAATTVLYSLGISEEAIDIPPGETVVLEGGYRDPSQTAKKVGGANMVQPIANTDFGFFSNADGTGTDLSPFLRVFTDGGRTLGGNSFRVELRNDGEDLGFLRLNATTAFQLRGRGVNFEDPFLIERRDGESVRRNGPRTVQIDLMYESNIWVASAVGDYLIATYNTRGGVPDTLSILGNVSGTMMAHALERQIGDKVGVVETVTGVTADDPDSDASIGYFINEKTIRQEQGGIIKASFKLAPAGPPGPLWILDEVGASELDESTRLGF